MTPLRVALLDWVGDPSRPGAAGLGDVVWELANELRNLGDEPIVVGAYDRGAQLPFAGIAVHRLDVPRWWWRNIGGQFLIWTRLARRASAIRPDLVFAPEYLSAAVATVLAPDLPVVLSTPGNIYERIARGNPFDWSTTQVYKVAALIAARRCAHVMAISKDMAHWWRLTGTPEERLSIVPYGIDLDLFRPAPGARERLGIPPDEEMVLYAGRFSVEKNLPALIEATALLAGHRPRLRLHLLGSGPDLPQLEQLVSDRGVADRVRFRDWVPKTTLPDYYRAADLFALPSTSEPLGRVVLEAMACGTFVVASSSSGPPDLIHHEATGLLVDPTDTPRWAEAIDRAMASAEWRNRVATAGEAHVRGRYGWPQISSRLRDEVFKPVARARRGAPARS